MNIFDQMTSVFDEILTPGPQVHIPKPEPTPTETVTVDGDVMITHIVDNSEEVKVP